MVRFDTAQRRDRLARRHRLLAETRTDDVARIADDLVALHSTDPVTVFVSAMVRMNSPSVDAVERALYEDRTLVRHHAMRRTLWVATPPVVRLLHGAATRKIAGAERRRTEKLLAENGIEDPSAWLDDARDRTLELLRDAEPMITREVGRRIPELGHPIELAPGKRWAQTQSAHVRVLALLGFEGHLVRTRPTGSWISSQYAWSATDAWLEGGLGELEERTAAAELADRWLRRFGPATATDLQWWMGWTKTLTRHALAACGAEQVDCAGEPGWVAAGDTEPVEPAGPWVALLPGLDPTTMGWKQRDWYLPDDAAAVFDSAGNGGPAIWVDGVIRGSWVQTPEGEVRLHWFADVGSERRAEAERRAEQIAGWLGQTRFRVRFPAPVQDQLLD